MKATLENMQSIARLAMSKVSKNTSIEDRLTILSDELKRNGFDAIDAGQKPCKGASFSVIELKNSFRINYRCGYGMYNYAPCVEVKK